MEGFQKVGAMNGQGSCWWGETEACDAALSTDIALQNVRYVSPRGNERGLGGAGRGHQVAGARGARRG